MKKLITVLSIVCFVPAAFAQPGAEDQKACEQEALKIVKTILQVQENRTDIDTRPTGSWGTEDGGEAGTIVWHDIKGIIVDKDGKKIRDLDFVSSEIKFVQNGSTCTMIGYSLPGAN